MAAIFDIHGNYASSPIIAATSNNYNDKISSTIAAIIDAYNDFINPRRYADELTEDLWIQIFVRLSVKSLLRVLCVCKHWYVLIKDARFTREHLQFQKTMSENMGHFLLYHDYRIDGSFNYFVFDGESVSNESNSLLSLPSYRNIFHFAQGEISPFKIQGPLNGLYCVHNEDGRIVIWNPATYEVAFLPLPGPYLPGDDIYYGKDRFLFEGIIGFGTDLLDEEDYKVILLSGCCYNNQDDCENDYVTTYVMLYTTKTNTWRHLKDSYRVVESLNNTYLNGSYYWMSELKHTILEFDMSKESFRFIPTPCDGNIALHNNRITLFDTIEDLNEIDIWVMLEYSNWFKLKKICVGGIQGCVVKTLGFWKTENDLIIVIDDYTCRYHKQTVLYNTTTLGSMNIGPKGYSGGFKACLYYESLVSLSGEITKLKENDNASLFDTVRGFLLEYSSDDDEDIDL